jgi:hypothetical protein
MIHLFQILGYARVAEPPEAFLISTNGVGSSIQNLIKKYDRSDVLDYKWEKSISTRKVILGKWDRNTKSLDPNTVLPPGDYSHQ